MNIDGMGESLVTQLIERGLVKNVADIYDLSKKDLLSLDRFADKSAQNILDEIENSKKLPLERVIYGLGIRMVGERTAHFSPSTSARWKPSNRPAWKSCKTSTKWVRALPKASSSSSASRQPQTGRTPRGSEADAQRPEKRTRHETRRPDICPHRDAGAFHPRRGQKDHRRCWRKSNWFSQQKDRLRSRGRRCRFKARQGEGTRRRSDRRKRIGAVRKLASRTASPGGERALAAVAAA